MIKPGRLSKEKLVHPRSEQRSMFQGDVIRPKEEQGFAERRKVNGCTVTQGTRQPSGLKHSVDSSGLAPPRPIGRAIQPLPTTPPPLTDRQQRMTKGGKGRKR